MLTTVNGTIRRIEYGYDDLSRISTLSSYNAASGGSVVNQVKYTYDGWGNVIKSEQAHDGAVTTGKPAVRYAYDVGPSAGAGGGGDEDGREGAKKRTRRVTRKCGWDGCGKRNGAVDGRGGRG